MGGFNKTVKSLALDKLEVAVRPGEICTLANFNPGNLFTIAGGPVWIQGIFAQATVAAETTAATAAITINLIAAQNAAVNVNSGLLDIIVWPLEATALSVIIPNVAINPFRTLGAIGNFMYGGQVAGPGAIALTVSANMDSTFVFYVVYYRMSPESIINPV